MSAQAVVWSTSLVRQI